MRGKITIEHCQERGKNGWTITLCYETLGQYEEMVMTMVGKYICDGTGDKCYWTVSIMMEQLAIVMGKGIFLKEFGPL